MSCVAVHVLLFTPKVRCLSCLSAKVSNMAVSEHLYIGFLQTLLYRHSMHFAFSCVDFDTVYSQVKQAARAYRVYFTKTDDSEDYLVDHSIIMYLIDPEGSFVSFYGKNYTEDQLIKAIGQQISSWKKACTTTVT